MDDKENKTNNSINYQTQSNTNSSESDIKNDNSQPLNEDHKNLGSLSNNIASPYPGYNSENFKYNYNNNFNRDSMINNQPFDKQIINNNTINPNALNIGNINIIFLNNIY